MDIYDGWGNKVRLLRAAEGVVEVRYDDGDTEVLDERELRAEGGWHVIAAEIDKVREPKREGKS